MRYRKLTADGDMTFGHGAADFHADTPACVGQACLTRLRLWLGDWFLDTEEGTDYLGSVLGMHTAGLYDTELRERIAGTQGVAGLASYASVRDGNARALAVRVTIDTIYGSVTLAAPVAVGAPVVSYAQALGSLLGNDGDVLLGADGQLLVGPTDPSLQVYV